MLVRAKLQFEGFDNAIQSQQEAISQKEIVFRFQKDIQSEKGWRFAILCMRSPGVKGICAAELLWDSLSFQSLRLRRDIVLNLFNEKRKSYKLIQVFYI